MNEDKRKEIRSWLIKWDELFVVIKSPYDTQKAIELDNMLAEEWFLDRMRDTKGDLNISEEPL
jgi:hypothetical protein